MKINEKVKDLLDNKFPDYQIKNDEIFLCWDKKWATTEKDVYFA